MTLNKLHLVGSSKEHVDFETAGICQKSPNERGCLKKEKKKNFLLIGEREREGERNPLNKDFHFLIYYLVDKKRERRIIYKKSLMRRRIKSFFAFVGFVHRKSAS